VEYLLSERNNAINEVVYTRADNIEKLKIERHIGKIQMIDAFLNLPQMVQLKLKEEQVQ
jgi:hypothetical protein